MKARLADLGGASVCVSWQFPAASAINNSASLRLPSLLRVSIVGLRLATMVRFV
jgi:hypothetical protein